MTLRVIGGIDELETLVGQRLGVSPWVEITQARIDAFAEATGDRQWIHCDAERAQAESPYGKPIAHGFLTLSLYPALAAEICRVEGVRMAINYGLNRVRFPHAVVVGARVRMASDLVDVRRFEGGAQAVYRQTFEIEGVDKPACVAEAVVRLLV